MTYPIQLTEKTLQAIEECSCGICGNAAHATIIDGRVPICRDCPEWEATTVDDHESMDDFLTRMGVPNMFNVARSIAHDFMDPTCINGRVEWR